MALQMTSAGLFGVAGQSGLASAGTNFYWFPLVNCDYGPMEGQDNLPPEIGGAALTRGRFKTGIVMGGNVDIVPRLQDRIAWLLWGAIGYISTHTDQAIAQVIAGAGANVGVNTHQFYFDTTDEFETKYFTTHKVLPHSTPASEVGEIGMDNRITNLTIAATPASVATMRFGMLGRATADPAWVKDPDGADWVATYDDEDSFMVTSCTGSVEIEGTEYDTGAVTVTLMNNLLPPAQGRKIGSGHPIDYPVLSRSLVIATTCFVADYDLYMQTFSGAAAPVVDAGWSCTPYSGDFDVILESDAAVTGAATAVNYQMRMRTTQNNVNFMARPIVLVPNQPVVFQLIGNVQNPDSGNPFDFYIHNESTYGAWGT